MKKVRLYLIIGSVALIVELLLAFWGYGIVTKLEQKETLTNSKNRNRSHDRPPDGHFNGFPVFYHDLTLDKTYHSHPYSSVRCVGENYQGDDFAWMHRSCHFRFLCFNVSSREFEVYARPDEEILESIMGRRPSMDLSSSVIPPPRVRGHGYNDDYNETGAGVSLASGTVEHSRYHVNDRDKDYRRRVKQTYDWFPTVIRSSPPDRYYALEEDMIFVPFHSVFTEKAESRGKEYSVIWDDLFPIYTLLQIFQLSSLETRTEALLMRYVPWENRLSDLGRVEDKLENLTNEEQSNLQRLMDPFRPLMMRHDPYDDDRHPSRERQKNTYWTSQVHARLTPSAGATSTTSPGEKMLPLQSGLVCAKDGVAGLGPNGIRYMNGKNNMNIFHNSGKGGLLWMFRNYCLNNLGLLASPSSLSEIRGPPGKSDNGNSNSTVRITISVPSLSRTTRVEDGVPLQIKNKAVDFKLLEIGLRDFLSSSVNRGDDENVITDSNNHHRAGTTNSQIEIESHDMSKNSANITARMKLMMDTKVLIATCGDATATAAIFLPHGASLIVLYNNTNESHEVDGMAATVAGDRDIRDTLGSKFASDCLDYQDLLNNISHISLHWLPMSALHSEEGRKTLFGIVQYAMRVYDEKRK